jgi:hypothetical protein
MGYARGEFDPAPKFNSLSITRGASSTKRQQQAKPRKLRAATSMASLWRDRGKRQQARQLSAPGYGWFTQGFDALDLQ